MVERAHSLSLSPPGVGTAVYRRIRTTAAMAAGHFVGDTRSKRRITNPVEPTARRRAIRATAQYDPADHLRRIR
jgi:hypothetical protein